MAEQQMELQHDAIKYETRSENTRGPQARSVGYAFCCRCQAVRLKVIIFRILKLFPTEFWERDVFYFCH